jgi:glycosyltransferase 2 family protein
MSPRIKSTLKFVLRWGIAVAGITYVLSNIALRDTATVLDDHNRPETITVQGATEAQPAHVVATSPPAMAGRTFARSDLVSKPDAKSLKLAAGPSVTFLAVRLSNDLRTADALLVSDSPDAPGRWIKPADVSPPYAPRLPHPLIEPGVLGMIAKANPWLLWGALAVFPITIAITSWRFDMLLRLLDIHMRLWRAFEINMVGAFYNTFMPGSTGGDVLKAYYASKLTTHRTRAVMCVVVDRILGMIALVILGGSTAAMQWNIPACRRVALGSAAILLATALGLSIFYHPTLRRITGLDFVLRRLPMQHHIASAVESMEIYGRSPWHIAWAVLITLPVHGAVVTAAMLSGFAFGLPLHWQYYWAAVPVIVLSGSIPISPQGAGVMEAFAILLTRPQGVTVAQAFALTMSIRIVQIFWNLTGGIFVLRGGYHALTPTERETLETDLPETPSGFDENPPPRPSNPPPPPDRPPLAQTN